MRIVMGESLALGVVGSLRACLVYFRHVVLLS